MKAKKLKLKNSTRWEVMFYLNGRGSKRIRKRFDRKVDADEFIKEYLKTPLKKKEEASSKEDKLTLFSEGEYWLKTRGPEISVGHLLRVEGILNKLYENYGHYPILRFDHALLSKIRNNLLKNGLSVATVNRWISSITSIMNYSFSHKRIFSNPSSGFKLIKEVREGISFWERSEASNFLKYCENKYLRKDDNWKYLVYLLALNTGLRAGEIWGLKVKDFKWTRGHIHISRQFCKASKTFKETKGKDNRRVPLNDSLKKLFSEYLDGEEANDLVFRNKSGNAINHNNFRSRQFLNDVSGSKVREIRFHDLRHTALTHMVDSGINMKTIQYIAGHKEITTTMKYIHLLGSSLDYVASNFKIA